MRRIFISIFLISIISAQETEYFQQYVDYDISVILNDKDHTLTAYEKLLYKNNSPDTLNFIWFHIWPNAYKNDSTAFAKQKGSESKFSLADSAKRGFIDSLDFSVNGKKVNWETHPEWIDVVKVNLNSPLIPGKSIIIETPFFVKIPIQFSRLGHTGQHYEITQWYPKPAVYDHKGWHPMPYLNMGEFYSEFGSFDVKITLPKDYRIMATGDLINGEAEYKWLDSLTTVSDSIHNMPKVDFTKWVQSQKKGNSKKEESDSIVVEMKTLHFHQNHVHDFAWFADKRYLIQKGELSLSDSTRKVVLWSFYLPKNAKKWENSVEYLHDAGYWYSRYYGDYPYNHITAVDGDMSAGGGMEYPNITVIAAMPSKHLLEMVIMHEVGHNWFYGILGSNERYHTWMDEGFNEYTCIRYWQDKYADQNERFVMIDLIQNNLGIAKNLKFSWFEYFSYAMSAKSPDVQPLNLKADEYKGGNYGLNYNKTAVFTRFLQHYLGEEKMDEIMQDYYETWKFKHPYPEDVRAVFEKHTEKDLSWYFDGVFNTTDYLDFSINEKGNRFTISNEGDLKTPVEIVFYGDNHKELERRWLEGFEWRTVIDGPAGVWYAIIDPDEHMPDVNRTNNATRKEVHFNWIWDQPTFYDHDINYLPWFFSYNYYNGWTPGLFLYKGFIFGYRNVTTIHPMWDFKNNKFVGKFSTIKAYDPNDLFSKSSLGFRAFKLAGNTSGAVIFQGSFGEDKSKSNISSILNYSTLEMGAFDTTMYSTGKFNTVSVQYRLTREMDGTLKQSRFHIGVQAGEGFSSVWTEANLKLKFTKKYGTDIRVWAGSFLNDKNVPNQYRTYLSGGIDPNFSDVVLDRTGKSRMAILQHQYIKQGPGMRGFVTDENGLPVSSKGFTWGLNISPSIPLFIDVAGGNDFENTYTTVGLQFGPIILPLYQSWEVGEKTAKDWKWVKDRMRLTFSMEGIKIPGISN